MRHSVLGLALIVAGCSSSTSTPNPPTTGSGSAIATAPDGSGSGAPQNPPAKDAPMTLPDRDFEHGPSIYPADQLLAWLEQQKPDVGEIVLRLPVLCVLKPNKMNLKSTTVGSEAGALAIKVNDLSLGVPISAKMQGLCEGKDACMLWLRGVWRGGEDKVFQVSKVDGVIEDADHAKATKVEVAKK